jgi:hypothetical protein
MSADGAGLTMSWLAGWLALLGLTLDSLSVCVCLSSVYYPHRGFDHGNKQKEKTNSKLKT